jgi:hypothetical protein
VEEKKRGVRIIGICVGGEEDDVCGGERRRRMGMMLNDDSDVCVCVR